MAIGWYIVPYKIRDFRVMGIRPRYPEMDDYTTQINAADGAWAEVEVLGNRAIVKLRAPSNILSIADTVFKRLPKDLLDGTLSDLPTAAKTALKNEILDQGYTLKEIKDRFGNDLGDYTLRQVLKFMATRRKTPRYDSNTDEIILDGPDVACENIDNLDNRITD